MELLHIYAYVKKKSLGIKKQFLMANFLTMHSLYKIANSIKICSQFYNTELCLIPVLIVGNFQDRLPSDK